MSTFIKSMNSDFQNENNKEQNSRANNKRCFIVNVENIDKHFEEVCVKNI